MSPESQTRRINFVFKEPSDYQKHYVNGVYGGVTPRGDIHCHFFFEYPVLPEKQLFAVSPEGELGALLLTEIEGGVAIDPNVPLDEAVLTRDLKVGLIMKPDQAESIATWLLEKARSVRETAQG